MLSSRIQMVQRPILTRGLISWWPFEESSGTTAYDRIGGHNATLINGCVRVPGNFQQAIELNTTSSQYIDCGSAAPYNVGTGDFSICMWAKYKSVSNHFIFSTYAGGNFIWFGAGTADSKLYQFFTINSIGIRHTTELSINTPYHCAVTRINGTTTQYINGNAVLTDTTQSGNIDSSGNLVFGRLGSFGFYANALVEDPRFYGLGLTDNEILGIYHGRL